MDVVQVGETLDMPVWLDAAAAQADWIGVVNRIKVHTEFKGSLESGLCKMMTFGLGKHHGALQYHRANLHHGYEAVITAVSREMRRRKRLAFGLGVVENAYDEPAYIECFSADELEAGERRLLQQQRTLMGRIPFDRLDVLVVDQIGKEISGSGMDTNVIGRPHANDPKILYVIVLDLTVKTQGNAAGIGLADFTTQRLVGKIDQQKTVINCVTACAPYGCKIPAAYSTDRETLETALSCIGLTPPEKARVVRIRDTLGLSEIDISEALIPEAERVANIRILSSPAHLCFDDDGNFAPFTSEPSDNRVSSKS
jgi:hypothetical protein